jgi:hypothetical protein
VIKDGSQTKVEVIISVRILKFIEISVFGKDWKSWGVRKSFPFDLGNRNPTHFHVLKCQFKSTGGFQERRHGKRLFLVKPVF